MKKYNQLVGVVLVLGLQVAAASTVEVGTCKSGMVHFVKIQDAVNAVSPGDTILVCPGAYPEQVMISHPVTLKGIQAGSANNATIVVPAGGVSVNSARIQLEPGRPIAAQILVQSTAGVNISDLTVDGSGDGISGSPCPNPILIGIYYQNASGTVNHVRTKNQFPDQTFTCSVSKGDGIYQETDGSSPANITVANSTIRSYSSLGIGVGSKGTIASVTNNTIQGIGLADGRFENGIQMNFGGTGTISGNSVINDSFADSSGILCYSCHGAQISGNTTGNNDNGIVVASQDGFGDADSSSIKMNRIFGTGSANSFNSGLYLCSNSNVVQSNTINDSNEQNGQAIFIDSSCASTIVAGNNNALSSNSINGGCVGVLVNPSTSGTLLTANTMFDVANTVLVASSCTAPFAPVKNGGFVRGKSQ